MVAPQEMWTSVAVMVRALMADHTRLLPKHAPGSFPGGQEVRAHGSGNGLQKIIHRNVDQRLLDITVADHKV